MNSTENNRRSISKNILFQTINEILTVISPLITTPYLTRVLGPIELGRFSYARSVAYYFVIIFGLGINVYGSRKIANVRHDQARLDQVFSNLFWLCFASCLCGTAIYLLGVMTGIINPDDRILSLIMTIYVLSTALNVRWLFQGLELFNVTVIRSIVIRAVAIICVFLFVRERTDIAVYALIFAIISNFISELSLLGIVPRYINYRRPQIREMLREIVPLMIMFIPYMANLLLRHLDKVMLGMMSSLAQVGYYEAMDKIYLMLVVFTTSIGDVLLPRITSLVSTGKDGSANKLLMLIMRMNTGVSVAFAFGIAGIANELIPILLGREFYMSATLIKLVSPTIVLLAFSAIIRKVYILPRYKTNIFFASALSALLVNMLLNVLLIPQYEAIGAVIATVFAELVVVLVQFSFLHKELNYIPFFKDLMVCCAIGTIMFGIVRLIAGLSLPIGVCVVLQVSTGAVVYIVLFTFWLLMVRDETITLIIHSIKNHKGKDA